MLRWILYAFLLAITARKAAAALAAYRFRKTHGLHLARSAPQTEKIIGLSLFRRMQQSSQAGVSLQRHYEGTREDGPTISAVVMGTSFISTSDPDNIKAVLATQFRDFNLGARNEAFEPFLGHGIFTADGVDWERSRNLIRPSLSKAQISELPIIEQHVQNLLSRIPDDGSTIDLQPLFFNFTLDSATHSLLGQPVGFQLSPPGSDAEKFSRAFDDAQAHLQVRAKLGPFLRFVKNKAFDADCRLVHSSVDGYVTDALLQRSAAGPENANENERKRYDLLSELVNTTTDSVQIRNELLNVLLAARDTTASLLSHVFFELSRHPAVWTSLHHEVARLDGQLPTYTQLREMKYVRAVLNEALRLYPPVPTNIRCATRHTSLPRGGGPDGTQPVFVTKGSIVHYSIWTMHRSAAIYGSDAEQFRPERWLDEKTPLRPGWGYLPFSGGPRICLGQQKALTEAAYVVVRMVQRFGGGLESRDGRPWREHMGLVLSSYYGVQVGFRL